MVTSRRNIHSSIAAEARKGVAADARSRAFPPAVLKGIEEYRSRAIGWDP